MAVAITIANEILKLDYIEVVRDLLNSSTVLNHRLEKDFESVQGERVYIGLNVARNPSFSSRASDADLPDRGTQGYDATHFTIPEMYGRLLVREKDIKASRNSKGALIRVLDTEMRHLIRDSKNAINRMNFGDGTGIIARVNGDPGTSATVTVDVEHQATGSNGTTDTYFNTRFALKGLKVDYVATKGAATRGVPRVIASTGTNTITMTAAHDAVVEDNDFIVVDGSSGQDQMGLLGIVDNGTSATRRFKTTLQGIDRSDAAKAFWNANVMVGAGGTPPALRDITLDLLQRAIDTAEIEGDGEVTAFITTYGIRRRILSLLVADKRFVAPFEMDLDGGFRALSYNGIPVIPDRHAPKHMVFALDEPTIRFYQMSDWEWMEEDGAVLNRIANKAQYEATLFLYREMACTDPKNNVRIDDLNDD